MAFTVQHPGFLSLLQDLGRVGSQHIGVTTGGPMDEQAFLWANHLLGNEVGAAQIEVSVGMLTLIVEQPTTIALTGADLNTTLNGERIVPWQTYGVRCGDKLQFGTPVTGLRAYLAVLGGFEAPKQLGSVSTVMREKIGGIHQNGQRLAAGDCLAFVPSEVHINTRVPSKFIPDYTQPLTIGLIPSYQYDSFSLTDINRFFSSEYTVSSDSDRMGYRLSGTAIHSSLNGIISEGIAYGAVQVPKDGQPIVLLKDRQTIGGYPKIGCVTSLDAARLSQLSPGKTVRFEPTTIEQASADRIIYNRFFGIS